MFQMRIDKMTEKKKIGEGTFGEVLLVKTGNGQEVVVKRVSVK